MSCFGQNTNLQCISILYNYTIQGDRCQPSEFVLLCPLNYGKSELSAFCTFCRHKMRKKCKVHVQRIAEICLLGFLHLLSNKKPKRCMIHTPRNLNFQHFQHNRKFLNPKMSIMSIYHTSKIESVTMCVDGDGLFETSRTSSRPSRIVTGNMYAVIIVLF